MFKVRFLKMCRSLLGNRRVNKKLFVGEKLYVCIDVEHGVSGENLIWHKGEKLAEPYLRDLTIAKISE